MMKQLLILGLFFFSVNLYCCDCKTIPKKKEYVNSNFIFLGKIISINDKYFDIEVLEVFKGKTIKTVRSYISDCSIYPNKGERWLLYSNINKENVCFISVCGNSRSFRNPFILKDVNLPSPPSNIPTLLDELKMQKNFEIALLELKLDVHKLRETKRENELIVFKRNYKCLENQIMILRIIVLGVILVFLFFVFRKYKV